MILAQTKLKAFVDDKFNADKIILVAFYRADILNTLWETGKNAGNQHFPLFPQCFKKALSPGLLNVRIVG